MRILGASVYEPQNGKDKASLRILKCSLDGECSLLEQGQCIEARLNFLSHGCIYGRITRTDGYTKRASKFYSKVKEFKAKRDEYGRFPIGAPKQLAQVGKYIWVPYPHMSMCESVPFKSHGGAFAVGIPFVLKEDFTAQAVVTLVEFQPRAMMGGIIKSYQEESVPLFLFHLKQEMPDLYKEAALLDEIVSSRTFSIDSLGGKATAKIENVQPGTEVILRRRKGLWNGSEIVIIQSDSSGLIGIYDSDVNSVTIKIKPKNTVLVSVKNELEIARLWGNNQVVI